VEFNLCGRVYELVSMFKTLNTSNPECEVHVSQVYVEEWIDAGKGIVVAHTIADGVLIIIAVYEL